MGRTASAQVFQWRHVTDWSSFCSYHWPSATQRRQDLRSTPTWHPIAHARRLPRPLTAVSLTARQLTAMSMHNELGALVLQGELQNALRLFCRGRGRNGWPAQGWLGLPSPGRKLVAFPATPTDRGPGGFGLAGLVTPQGHTAIGVPTCLENRDDGAYSYCPSAVTAPKSIPPRVRQETRQAPRPRMTFPSALRSRL